MKAVRIHGHGGPELLRYEDVPDPSPGPGEVLIDLKAVGVNYADIGERLGRIPMELPAVVGREAAGVVSQVGEGVSEVEVGDLGWRTRAWAPRMRSVWSRRHGCW